MATLGWRETFQVYAAVGAALLLLCGLSFPAPPRAAEHTIRALSQASRVSPGGGYPRFYLATVLVNLAMYVPFAHLPEAAQASGIAPARSAQVLGLLGITSVAGRLLVGALGARLDEWLLYRLCISCVAAGFVLWGLAGSFIVYLTYAIVGGFGYGGYIALTPEVIAREFPLARPGYLMGLTYTAVAIGASVGPVWAGLMAQWLGGYQIPLFILAGLTVLGLIPMAVFPTECSSPIVTPGHAASQRSGSRNS